MYWFNGRIVEDVAISPSDRGFLLGDGVFETILLLDGVPAFLEAHINRIQEGLTALKIKKVINEEEITTAINRLYTEQGTNDELGSVRLTVTRGAAQRGLVFSEANSSPTILIAYSPTPRAQRQSVNSAIISSYRRSETSITARHKTLNYLDCIMARNEVHDAGAEEAIMLNSRGEVACASSANVFVINADGAVSTPPVEAGALPGIVRNIILTQAAAASIPVAEQMIVRDDLLRDAVFLTNSLAGLREFKVYSVDDRALPDWNEKQQSVFNTLLSLYNAALEADISHRADSPQQKAGS